MFPFMDTFRNLQRVFPLRGDEHDLSQVGGAYFKALRRFPLERVQAGAEVWMQQGKRFPKPAEWIDSIPRQKAVVELPTLSSAQAAEYLRAEGKRYEDARCGCAACVKAGVSEQPLRFVPDYLDDGRDAQAMLGDRIVTTGHWAHGDELKGYYAARNAFWYRMFELFGAETPQQQRKVKRTFEQRLTEIYEEPKVESGKARTPTRIGR